MFNMIHDAQMKQIVERKEDGRVQFFGILEDKWIGFIDISAVRTTNHTRTFNLLAPELYI
jgi:hypothetical protein